MQRRLPDNTTFTQETYMPPAEFEPATQVNERPQTHALDRAAPGFGIPRLKLQTICGRLRLKCDGTRTETRFRLSAKRTSPFKLVGASFQSTTGSRGVRISGSNAGYSMFRGSVKCTGYPLHSPVSPSLPLPCVTVCHHTSSGVYQYIPHR
jgi:hypothetical protein